MFWLVVGERFFAPLLIVGAMVRTRLPLSDDCDDCEGIWHPTMNNPIRMRTKITESLFICTCLPISLPPYTCHSTFCKPRFENVPKHLRHNERQLLLSCPAH